VDRPLLQALGVAGVQRLLEVAEARWQRRVEDGRLQHAAREVGLDLVLAARAVEQDARGRVDLQALP
jgi:hypothetical protein